MPFDVMDAADFRKLEPYLQPVFHKAVRWTSSWRVNNPGGLTAAYANRFIKRSGNFIQATVDKLRQLDDGQWRVVTGSGDIVARNVVICAGPWANEMLRPLGYRFPLAMKRGYHRHYKAIGNATLSHAVVDVDIGYLLVPMEQGYRLTTGVEIAALDAPPTPKQIDRALPHVRALFPLGEPVETSSWLGNRPCFADSMPAIGPAKRHKGLWFNFGHGHVGLTTGPSSGRLLAEMMAGVKTFCDPSPFSAERFA